MRNIPTPRGLALLLPLLAVPLLAGCPNEFFLNNTKELTGNTTFVFVNNTSARAIFTVGTWNDLDRRNTRLVNILPLRVDANTATAAQTLNCGRNTAVATQRLVDWVARSAQPRQTGFDAAALNATVYFSSADATAEDADAPSAGYADGLELLLGVHYSCGDRIIYTFNEDPTEPGGFRIDYEVVRDREPGT